MSREKIYEPVTIDGEEIFHTYRGYNTDIEVYTFQEHNRTYSLYLRPGEQAWKCDWTASYNCQPIELEADPTNKDAMLKAFVAYKKSLNLLGGAH